MSMVGRLESSWVNLVQMPMILVLVVVTSYVLQLILFYYSIYIAFYSELADDTYSVLVPCTDPYLYFLYCYFVECSKCAIDFDSPSTLVSLQHIKIQGELLFLARAGFSPSRLDVLKFGHGPSFYLFYLLNTLRFRNLRIDVLDVMTFRFWE